MKAKGMLPGVVTYNSIHHKLCEEGKIKVDNSLLGEMSEKKIVPDNVTCNTLINAYCKIGDMESAIKVRNKMLEGGLSNDQFTYKALIHGFYKAKEMDKVKELLFDMLDVGFCLRCSTYSWILDGYYRQGNEEAVLSPPNELMAKGLGVDIAIYRAIKCRFCTTEDCLCTKDIQSYASKRYIWRFRCVLNLAYASLKVGNQIFASKMFDNTTNKNLMVTIKIYKSVNASYADDGDTLRLFWDHVVERGLVTKKVLIFMQHLD